MLLCVAVAGRRRSASRGSARERVCDAFCAGTHTLSCLKVAFLLNIPSIANCCAFAPAETHSPRATCEATAPAFSRSPLASAVRLLATTRAGPARNASDAASAPRLLAPLSRSRALCARRTLDCARPHLPLARNSLSCPRAQRAGNPSASDGQRLDAIEARELCTRCAGRCHHARRLRRRCSVALARRSSRTECVPRCSRHDSALRARRARPASAL
jgi:hypothetical protein